jgi:hypothetical protein
LPNRVFQFPDQGMGPALTHLQIPRGSRESHQLFGDDQALSARQEIVGDLQRNGRGATRPAGGNSKVSASSIIKPGAALSAAARPLSVPHRVEGKYPFQWLYPGPNSEFQRPSGIIQVPAIVAPATSAQAIVLSYEVPEGYRFVLNRLLMATNAVGYSPGQNLLLFTLQVKYSTGPRGVEFLTNLDYPTGRFITNAGAFETQTEPLDQRLEFEPLAVLQIIVTNNGLGAPTATDVAIGILQGHIYPESERFGEQEA